MKELRHMVKPRWLVKILAYTAASVAFAAAVILWVDWPVRTAQSFIELVELGRFDQANPALRGGVRFRVNDGWRLRSVTPNADTSVERTFVLVVPNSDATRGHDEWILLGDQEDNGFALPPRVWRAWFRPDIVELVPRTTHDLVVGRRRFRTIEGRLEFISQWGAIVSYTERNMVEAFVQSRNEWDIADDSPLSVAIVAVKTLSADEEMEFLEPKPPGD